MSRHEHHVDTVFRLLQEVAVRDGLEPAAMLHVLQHVLALWAGTTAAFLHDCGTREFKAAIDKAACDAERLIRAMSDDNVGPSH